MRIYLRLLGGARIDGESGPIRGRAAQRRRLALLALLAASPGHRLTRERIVAYLWPERDSDAGRRMLSEALHVIRRELGDATISSVGDELVLNPTEVGSDVMDFRAAIASDHLREALDLYHGPFLDGWYVSEAPALEEWAERERVALVATYAAALETLADRAEGAAEWARAVDWWRRRTELEPDSSRLVARLAVALSANGDRTAALKAIEAHVRHMEDEEYPVDPEVLELSERLRVAEPVRRRSSPAATAPLTVADSPSSSVELSGVSANLRKETDATVGASGVSVGLPSTAPRRARLLPLALIALGLLAISGTAALARRRALHRVPEGDGVSGGALDPTRIAVLYFAHHPGDDVGYIADGLTEKLIDELGRVPALRVVSKTGVKYYRDLDRMPPLDSIAGALHAGTIVEGSVQRAGDRIRVTVGLVDARSNTSVASRTIERPVDASMLFGLQDDIGDQVAAFLRHRLGDEVRMTASRMGTTSAAAQEFSDRAEYARNTAAAIRKHGTAADLPTAIRLLRTADSLFARSEETDPHWRSPTISRGWVARDLAPLLASDSAASEFKRAERHAERVLAIDPDDAKALELRGTVIWQVVASLPDRARSEEVVRATHDLRRALQLDSTRVVAAAMLSQLLRVSARSHDDLNQAIAYARQAYAQDAFLANAEDAVSQLYRANRALGQIDSASAWCERGHRLSPDDWRFVECRLALMRVDLARADPRRARQIAAELRRLDPAEKAVAAGRPYSPIYRRLVLATIQAAAGERDSARAELARALREVETDADLRVDIKSDESLLRFALGDSAGAIAALDTYLRQRPQYTSAVLNDLAYRQFGLDSSRLEAARVTKPASQH